MYLENMDIFFINKALQLALEGGKKGEIPIAALIVENNKIISKSYNQVEMLNDPTAHAEMLALSSAFSYKSSKYLKNCTLYTTLKPCPMCMAACDLSYIHKVVYLVEEVEKYYKNYKNIKSLYQIESQEIVSNYECILKEFFNDLRKRNQAFYK